MLSSSQRSSFSAGVLTVQQSRRRCYSSSFDTLKRAFVGVHKVIQANGQDEVEQSAVEE